MATFSSLISRTVPHHNKYSNRQGQSVVRVIQHHWAGTAGGVEELTRPGNSKSANYIILTSGEILGQVPEEYRAWTSGSADFNSITIEVQNINGRTNNNDMHPNSWRVSDKAYQSILNLLVDIARRYRWGGISRPNYRGHREFYATACPGGYLWSKMDSTVAKAHQMLTGGTTPPPTPPTTNKTVWELANEVLAGLHGNGDARRRSLGSMYSAVQREVNRRLGQTGSPSTPSTPAPKSIAQLADEVIAGAHGNGDARRRSLGSNYAAVQAEVNRRLGGRFPNGPSISQLADAVIRGDYGNGEARKAALGSNYAAVQAEVNRRLG